MAFCWAPWLETSIKARQLKGSKPSWRFLSWNFLCGCPARICMQIQIPMAIQIQIRVRWLNANAHIIQGKTTNIFKAMISCNFIFSCSTIRKTKKKYRAAKTSTTTFATGNSNKAQCQHHAKEWVVWSCLEKGCDLWGHSTSIFLCISPFSAWWQQPPHPVDT